MCELRKRMQLLVHSAAISPRPHPATGEYQSPPVGGHHDQARRIAFDSYGPPPSASLAGYGVSTWRVRPPKDPGRGVLIACCTPTAALGRSLGNAPPATAVMPARSDGRRASIILAAFVVDYRHRPPTEGENLRTLWAGVNRQASTKNPGRVSFRQDLARPRPSNPA
jgi:hypothetical protein